MKFRIFCLSITVWLFLQSCSRPAYPLLSAIPNNYQSSGAALNYSNSLPENITTSQANAGLSQNDHSEIGPGNKEGVTTPASSITAKPRLEQKAGKGQNEILAEKSTEVKIRSGNKIKRLKKRSVGSVKLSNEGKHVLIFFGISALLALLILYGGNALVTIALIIGILLGAVVAILLLLFILYASGIFGKMSG